MTMLTITYFFFTAKLPTKIIMCCFGTVLQLISYLSYYIVWLLEFICLDLTYISLFSVFCIYIIIHFIPMFSHKAVFCMVDVQERIACAFSFFIISLCLTSLTLMVYHTMDTAFLPAFSLCLIHCYFACGRIITGMNPLDLFIFTFTTLAYFVYNKWNENCMQILLMTVCVILSFLCLLDQDLLCHPPENSKDQFLSYNFIDIITQPGARSIEVVYNQYLFLETYPNSLQGGHKPHMYSSFWTGDLANEIYKQHNLTQHDFVLEMEERKYLVNTFRKKIEFKAKVGTSLLLLDNGTGISPHAKALDIIELIRRERTVADINGFVSRGGENQSIILTKLEQSYYNKF